MAESTVHGFTHAVARDEPEIEEAKEDVLEGAGNALGSAESLRAGLSAVDSDFNLADNLEERQKWVVCMLVVTFDLELGQAVELAYPPNHGLSGMAAMDRFRPACSLRHFVQATV